MKKLVPGAVLATLGLGLLTEDVGAVMRAPKSIENLPKATAIATGASTSAPYAHARLCRTNRAACSGGGASRIKLTSAKWNKLRSVNSQFNRSILSRSDRSIHGRSDVWTVGGRWGDCEDFALAKRRALIEHGVAASAMSIAVVRTAGGVGHAVLVVRTDRGDFVLDNRRSAVRAWNRTGYRYYKITSPINPRSWVTVRGSRAV